MNQQSDISKQWDIFNNNKERNIGAYKNNGKCPSNYVESGKKKRERDSYCVICKKSR